MTRLVRFVLAALLLILGVCLAIEQLTQSHWVSAGGWIVGSLAAAWLAAVGSLSDLAEGEPWSIVATSAGLLALVGVWLYHPALDVDVESAKHDMISALLKVRSHAVRDSQVVDEAILTCAIEPLDHLADLALETTKALRFGPTTSEIAELITRRNTAQTITCFDYYRALHAQYPQEFLLFDKRHPRLLASVVR